MRMRHACPYVGFIPILLLSVVSCVSDEAAPEPVESENSVNKEEVRGPRLTVLKRQIYPSRVIVHRVEGDGDHEVIEYAPSGNEIFRVLRGSTPEPLTVCSQLESAGFFAWPDSTLVPPPDVDVDSDPLIIVLDTGNASRRLFTREPHVPPAVRTVIETLESVVEGLKPAEACLVCIPEFARTPVSNIPDVVDLPGRSVRDLKRALAGPFPVVMPRSSAEHTVLSKNRVFSMQSEQGTYVVRCLDWP